MDLRKNLNLLTGNSSFSSDLDLAGVPRASSRNRKMDTDSTDFDEELELESISINNFICSNDKKKESKKEKRKSKKSSVLDDMDESTYVKKSMIDKVTETTKKLVTQADLVSADDFDAFLDSDDIWAYEENAELAGNLVSMGRKYARDNATSKESSEITKTFADSEKRLNELYQELEKDKLSIQKDIDKLRMPQRGNSKALTEIISAKNAARETQVHIVKEINAMRKLKYELRNKELAKKEAEAGNNDISPNTIQGIFSSARNSIMNGIGGYAAVSGSNAEDDSDEVYIDSNGCDDEIIQKKYFTGNSEEDDGDKFLKYENRGVEYVAIVNEGKVERVFAEDRDGILIPDYPLPNNIDELAFEIDPSVKMVKDNMHREYKLREV